MAVYQMATAIMNAIMMMTAMSLMIVTTETTAVWRATAVTTMMTLLVANVDSDDEVKAVKDGDGDSNDSHSDDDSYYDGNSIDINNCDSKPNSIIDEEDTDNIGDYYGSNDGKSDYDSAANSSTCRRR